MSFEKNWTEPLVLLGLTLVTLAVFANILQNAFVYDDYFLIVKNKALASDEYFSTIFTHSFAYDTGDEASYKSLAIDYYRPFIRLFFGLCYRAFGLNSTYWHLANLFIYLIVVSLCYFLVRELTTQRVAVLSTLLFAVHPLHSESVAYVNGSVDTLHAAFFLPAFLLFIFYEKEQDVKRRAEYLLGSCLLFLAAMLTKELAITLPPLIVIYVLLHSHSSFKERIWRSAKATLPFLATFICYLLLRLFTYGSLGARRALSGRLDWQTVLLSVPGVIVEYLRMMLLPIDLNLFRNVPEVSSPTSVRFLLTASIIILIIAACLRLPARLQMAAAVLFVTLVPALNIGLFPDNRTIQDRYAFISLLGLCIIVAELVVYLYTKAPRLAVSASVAMVLCLCILTVRQNSYWKDNLAIWKRVIDMHPGSAALHCNIASILVVYEKRIDEGVGYYRQALKLDPNADCALNGLAGYYYSIGDYKAAIDFWERALAASKNKNKDKRSSMMFLAQTYSMVGNNQKALEILERVISEFPDYTEAHTLHSELKQTGKK